MTTRARIQAVLTDIPDRLAASAREVADLREQLAIALARRNDLIVAAVDAGMEQRRVAERAGIKPPHVIRILGEHPN